MTSTRTNDDIMVTPSTKPTYGLGHKSLYCLPLLVNIMEQVLCLLFQLLTLILRNTRTPSPLPQYTLTTAPVHPHPCPSTPSPLPQYTLTTDTCLHGISVLDVRFILCLDALIHWSCGAGWVLVIPSVPLILQPPHPISLSLSWLFLLAEENYKIHLPMSGVLTLPSATFSFFFLRKPPK